MHPQYEKNETVDLAFVVSNVYDIIPSIYVSQLTVSVILTFLAIY